MVPRNDGPERLTRRRLLRAGGVLASVGVAGCQEREPAPATSTEVPSTPSPSPTEGTPTPTDERVRYDLPRASGCPDGTIDGAPTQASEIWVDPADEPDLYDGPIHLAHEHLYLPDPRPEWNWEMGPDCLPWFLAFMERNDVSNVLSFLAPHQIPALEDRLDRFSPFLVFPHVSPEQGGIPFEEWPRAFESLLSSDTTWSGVGEIALYAIDGETQELRIAELPKRATPADHPVLSDVYDVATDHDAVVMLHPYQLFQLEEQYRTTPMESPEVRALRRTFDDHPETTFLVHGLHPIGEWIATLLEEHSNWYYDVSADVPHAFSPAGSGPPVDYAEHMTPEHVAEHARTAYDQWRPIFQREPERVVVGFDTFIPWHLDDRVLDSWIRLFRGILGHLSDEVAADVGHRNAERMLGP